MPAPPPVIEVDTQVGSLLAHRDDEVITANLIRWGVWEARETEFLRTVLRPGDTFVDVGANIGYFSVLAAGCIGRSGYVIAIRATGTTLPNRERTRLTPRSTRSAL